MHADIELFDSLKSGEISHQLSSDVATLQTFVRTSFTRGIESLSTVVSGLYMLHVVSPELTFLMVLTIPLAAGSATFLSFLLRQLSMKSRELGNQAAGMASESIQGIRTIRAFASEEREIDKYQNKLQEGAVLKTQMAVSTGLFYAGLGKGTCDSPILGLGVNLGTLLIGNFGGGLIAAGKISKGDVAGMITQVQLIERAVTKLSELSGKLSKVLVGTEHIFAQIHSQPRIRSGTYIPQECKGHFTLIGISSVLCGGYSLDSLVGTLKIQYSVDDLVDIFSLVF